MSIDRGTVARDRSALDDEKGVRHGGSRDAHPHLWPVAANGAGYGPVVRSWTVVPEFTVPPLLLMMCWIVPVPPNDTVTMSWNPMPAPVGVSIACAAWLLGLAWKKQ